MSINAVKPHESDQYLRNYFVNLKTELTNTVDDALLNGQDVSKKLDSFISFSNDVLSQKGYSQSIIYKLEGSKVTINLYLKRGEEYYKDRIIIDRRIYT
jgi:hypothetical protein